MKKIIYFLAIAFIFVSCKKEPRAPSTLVGSTWSYHPDKKHYETIEFLDDHKILVTGNLIGRDYSKDGTYTYHKSNVMIQLNDEQKSGYATATSLFLYDRILFALLPEYSVTYEYKKD